MNTAYTPVVDSEGQVILYDIYVGGVWIGSARTIAQCDESVKNYGIVLELVKKAKKK